MRPAGKATEQRAEKRKPAKHPGGRKKTGAVYLGAKAFRWERASSLLLTASIPQWTMSCPGEEERQLLGHLDPSGRVQQRQHRLSCSFLPGSTLSRKISSSLGKMIIVYLFQTISDTANTFQVGKQIIKRLHHSKSSDKNDQ